MPTTYAECHRIIIESTCGGGGGGATVVASQEQHCVLCFAQLVFLCYDIHLFSAAERSSCCTASLNGREGLFCCCCCLSSQISLSVCRHASLPSSDLYNQRPSMSFWHWRSFLDQSQFKFISAGPDRWPLLDVGLFPSSDWLVRAALVTRTGKTQHPCVQLTPRRYGLSVLVASVTTFRPYQCQI